MSDRTGLAKTSVDLAFRRANVKINISPPNATLVLMIIAGADTY